MQCALLRLLVLILPGWGSTSFPMKGSGRTGRIQPSGLQAAPILTVKPTTSLCNAQFCGSFWATVGQVASAGLEEEVTAMVGAVAGEDPETFSSQGGKSASIALIVGRGLWPLIMF